MVDQVELEKWWTEYLPPDIRETDAKRTNIRPPRENPWEYDKTKKRSGNGDLDYFIEDKKLKWIPYDELAGVEEFDKGGFGTIYKATFKDKKMKVALKSLNVIPHENFKTFLKEWQYHADCLSSYQIVNFLGFTVRETENKEGQINYMAVMEYADNGTLYSNLKNVPKYSWKEKLYILYKIATGLSFMHSLDLIHRDLHHRNILFNNSSSEGGFVLSKDDDVLITDLGLCQSINSVLAEKGKKKSVYGIAPFVAPEVLGGGDYVKASDIYSFSMIMWELTSGIPPSSPGLGNVRPKIVKNTPNCYAELMKECWDEDPSKRPTVFEVADKIFGWISYYSKDKTNTIEKQVMEFKNAIEIEYNNDASQSYPGSKVINLNTNEVLDTKAIGKMADAARAELGIEENESPSIINTEELLERLRQQYN